MWGERAGLLKWGEGAGLLIWAGLINWSGCVMRSVIMRIMLI